MAKLPDWLLALPPVMALHGAPHVGQYHCSSLGVSQSKFGVGGVLKAHTHTQLAVKLKPAIHRFQIRVCYQNELSWPQCHRL